MSTAVKKANTFSNQDMQVAAAVRKDAGGGMASADGAFSPLSVDANSCLRVNTERQTAMYDMVASGLSVAASATDILTINGSATKKVAVHEIVVNGSATTAINTPVSIIRRSTAGSGGTSAALTIVRRDLADSTATATAQSFTANPTVGTAVGTIASKNCHFNTATTVSGGATFTFNPPVILGDASATLAVSLGGVTVAGGSLNITATIDERPTTA